MLCCFAPAALPISFDDAVSIVLREIQRRGLSETHHVAALYGETDATAEGAAFAAMISPRGERPSSGRCDPLSRLKLLIAADGRVSVRDCRSRTAAFQGK